MAPTHKSMAASVFIEIPLLVLWNCSYYSLPWTITSSAHCLSNPASVRAWKMGMDNYCCWPPYIQLKKSPILPNCMANSLSHSISLATVQTMCISEAKAPLSQSGQPSSKALLNFNLRWQNERGSTFGEQCMGQIHLMPGASLEWLTCLLFSWLPLNLRANLQQFSHKDLFPISVMFKLFWI